jgi:predicted nucleotidyltransferase
MMRAREGDLLEAKNGIVFDVKGLTHPPERIICFPRFIPDAEGERRTREKAYRKVYSLPERFKFLKQNYPHYLVNDPVFDELLCEVPNNDVKKFYRPNEKLEQLRNARSLDIIETKALRLIELLKKEANISWNTSGISGSLLTKLHTANSDIDPIVYGSENCQKAYAALKNLCVGRQRGFKQYLIEDLKKLFDFRSKDTVMSFEDFVRTESRKVVQGMFNGTDYFLRFVKDWNEINEDYGDVRYKNCGYTRIKATVEDDRESIFTPCSYKACNVKILEGKRLEGIEEISSFRGRFCEQAISGEIVVAQGKIERVVDTRKNREHYRLLLGNKSTDFMILA